MVVGGRFAFGFRQELCRFPLSVNRSLGYARDDDRGGRRRSQQAFIMIAFFRLLAQHFFCTVILSEVEGSIQHWR